MYVAQSNSKSNPAFEDTHNRISEATENVNLFSSGSETTLRSDNTKPNKHNKMKYKRNHGTHRCRDDWQERDTMVSPAFVLIPTTENNDVEDSVSTLTTISSTSTKPIPSTGLKNEIKKPHRIFHPRRPKDAPPYDVRDQKVIDYCEQHQHLSQAEWYNPLEIDNESWVTKQHTLSSLLVANTQVSIISSEGESERETENNDDKTKSSKTNTRKKNGTSSEMSTTSNHDTLTSINALRQEFSSLEQQLLDASQNIVTSDQNVVSFNTPPSLKSHEISSVLPEIEKHLLPQSTPALTNTHIDLSSSGVKGTYQVSDSNGSRKVKRKIKVLQSSPKLQNAMVTKTRENGPVPASPVDHHKPETNLPPFQYSKKDPKKVNKSTTAITRQSNKNIQIHFDQTPPITQTSISSLDNVKTYNSISSLGTIATPEQSSSNQHSVSKTEKPVNHSCYPPQNQTRFKHNTLGLLTASPVLSANSPEKVINNTWTIPTVSTNTNAQYTHPTLFSPTEHNPTADPLVSYNQTHTMSTPVRHYPTVSSQPNTYPLFSLSSSEVPGHYPIVTTSSTTDPPVSYKQLDHIPSRSRTYPTVSQTSITSSPSRRVNEVQPVIGGPEKLKTSLDELNGLAYSLKRRSERLNIVLKQELQPTQ